MRISLTACLITVLSVSASVSGTPTFADSARGTLVERRPLDSPFADRAAFMAFMEKGPGWRRDVLERAFPEGSVAACIAQKDLSVEHLRYRGEGGVVNAWAVLPRPRRDSSRRDAPLVIFNRGGAAKWGRLLALDRFTFCRLAEAGYAVLASDFRGDPPGQGGEGRTDLGPGDARDSIDLIALADTLGGIDTERIALWGFSRGTMINAIMLGALDETRADHVHAAIMVGTSADSVDSARRAEFDEHVYPLLVPDWNELSREAQDARLRAISPRYLIDRIRGMPAFLFIHGNVDQRTPPAAMLRYAASLVDAGHRVGVHVVDGANHALAEDYDLLIELILDWLDEHLRVADDLEAPS